MKQLILFLAVLMLFGSMIKPDVLICGQQIESRYFYKGKIVRIIKHPPSGFWLNNLTGTYSFRNIKPFKPDSMIVRIVSPLQSNYR